MPGKLGSPLKEVMTQTSGERTLSRSTAHYENGAAPTHTALSPGHAEADRMGRKIPTPRSKEVITPNDRQRRKLRLGLKPRRAQPLKRYHGSVPRSPAGNVDEEALRFDSLRWPPQRIAFESGRARLRAGFGRTRAGVQTWVHIPAGPKGGLAPRSASPRDRTLGGAHAPTKR